MKRTYGLLIAASLVLFVGCQKKSTVAGAEGSSQEVGSLDFLVARARPPIPDLPVPVGFKLVESKSRNYEAGGARYIDHVYKGKADKFTVKRFYERQMPISRWVLVSYRFIRGDIFMEFDKDTERCDIMVVDAGMFSSLTVKITVWTSGPMPAPPSDVKEQW